MSQHRAFVSGVAAAAPSADTRSPVVGACPGNQARGPNGNGAFKEKGWIEVVIEDEEGQPVAFVRVRVTTPDGQVIEATTTGDGMISLPGVPDGTCKVEFPKLDRRALEAA